MEVRQTDAECWLVKTPWLALFVEGPKTTVLTACCLAWMAQVWAPGLAAAEEARCDSCGEPTGLLFDPQLGVTASAAKLERLLETVLSERLDPLAFVVEVPALVSTVEDLQASRKLGR